MCKQRVFFKTQAEMAAFTYGLEFTGQDVGWDPPKFVLGEWTTVVEFDDGDPDDTNSDPEFQENNDTEEYGGN